ncbi:hypothetical protein NDU88_003725 [Pleurodeles waltl]|uniref:Uncharacterized protein n=1 Tax=Pleurodeles waltl TaxID=8319 RepID=A0AAV7V0V0_PLEWA|nr:hypothetical protein NDU88_003725 [Pleurodeles waltl]
MHVSVVVVPLPHYGAKYSMSEDEWSPRRVSPKKFVALVSMPKLIFSHLPFPVHTFPPTTTHTQIQCHINFLKTTCISVLCYQQMFKISIDHERGAKKMAAKWPPFKGDSADCDDHPTFILLMDPGTAGPKRRVGCGSSKEMACCLSAAASRNKVTHSLRNVLSTATEVRQRPCRKGARRCRLCEPKHQLPCGVPGLQAELGCLQTRRGHTREELQSTRTRKLL